MENVPAAFPATSIMWQGFSDFSAGAMGGTACVFAGQPLDTVKVKLQTFPTMYRGALDCLAKTIKEERLQGLYTGTVPALAANIAENAILFAFYGLCQKVVQNISGVDSVNNLSSLQSATAGSMAAFFSSIGLCPTELVKCRLQAIKEMAAEGRVATANIGPWGMTKQIVRQEGFRGLFQGMTSTWAREVPGYFFFFGGYELSRKLLTPAGKTKDDLGPMRLILCGGVAGSCLWASIYPIDVVKSRIQVYSLSGRQAGFMAVFLQILRTEGVRALFSGIGPCLIRTFPANGALFIAYEYSRKSLLQLGENFGL
ncbi:mitochondrial ornithine transporter 1-like [Branchiostoma lanceolatum]|uniref:mitochondrial ornithine transporter 1-like n=1 Tax=Branchiostoma lanceolatum TaxID=7740 RepID=UPI001132A93B